MYETSEIQGNTEEAKDGKSHLGSRCFGSWSCLGSCSSLFSCDRKVTFYQLDNPFAMPLTFILKSFNHSNTCRY